MSEPQIPASHAPASVVGGRSFVGHARIIGLLTLVSRILGMAREAVSAHYFGAGLVASAFTVAFTIPNLFRKLFGEGALSAAFIPLYAQALKEEKEEKLKGKWKKEKGNGERAAPSANDFAAASVTLLTLILVAITILGEGLLAGLILLDPGMRPDRLLTLKLATIMLPYVVLICGTAFLSAILQVHRRFAVPAAAPVLLNVIHIIVIVVGARLLQLHARDHSAQVEGLQIRLAYWLAFFVLVAGVLQVAILLPVLRQVGFRFVWAAHFWTAPVRRMLKLSAPVALGAGALQLSVLTDKGLSLLLQQSADRAGHVITHFQFFGWTLAYPMEMGAPARLNWAQFLYQFPLGIFAIALATALFPGLSANALDNDRRRFKEVLRHGIEMTLWEGFPASVGLILVRHPAVKLLFQHGEITPHDSALIAQSVLLYSTAIWAFSLQQILNRAYYALHDTLTPLVMSGVTLAVNLAVEIPLLWAPLWYNAETQQWQRLGEAGMAAGTCASFALQAVMMLWMVDRRVGGLGLRESFPKIIKMLLATAGMAAACVGVEHLPFYPAGESRVVWALQLGLLIGAGAVVYLGLCALLGVAGLKSKK